MQARRGGRGVLSLFGYIRANLGYLDAYARQASSLAMLGERGRAPSVSGVYVLRVPVDA